VASGGASGQAVDQPSGVTYRWHVRVTGELAAWRGADARGITQVWAEEMATGNAFCGRRLHRHRLRRRRRRTACRSGRPDAHIK